MHDPTTRTGMKSLSNWQREVIRKTYVAGSRRDAALELGIPVKTLDDLLWRAYKVLGVKKLRDAFIKIASQEDVNT